MEAWRGHLIRRIDLIVGPCRSGTSWLQKAISSGEPASIWQPLKHAIRTNLGLNDAALKLGAAGPHLIIKEAFGPYLIDECVFDPVAILQTVYPESQIRLAICFRDIAASVASWSRSFKNLDREVILLNLQLALFNTYSIYRRARLQGYPILLFSPSNFAGFPGPEVVADRLRIFFGLDQLNNDFSRISKVRDPIRFENPGALDRAKATWSFAYSEQGTLNRLAGPGADLIDFILKELTQALIGATPEGAC